MSSDNLTIIKNLINTKLLNLSSHSGSFTGNVIVDENLYVYGEISGNINMDEYTLVLPNAVEDSTTNDFLVLDSTNTVKKRNVVYGNNFQYSESLAEDTTLSTSYVSKLSFTTTTLPAGIYQATFTCAVANVVPGNNIQVQFLISAGGYDVEIIERSSISISYKNINASYIISVPTTSTRTLDINYKSPSGSTVYIKQAQISIVRVGNLP